MSYLQILLLAVIQGAAELLPVSSSAHVIFTAKLMGLQPTSPEFVFLLIMLHTGTMFAVLFYFWPRWRPMLLPPPTVADPAAAKAARFHFLKMIVIATFCTGVLGIALKELIEKVILGHLMHQPKAAIEDIFGSLPLMACSLLAVGIFILIAGLREETSQAPVVSQRNAIWIGLVQGLCLPFRGFSRSGATISTALCGGVARPLAEDFSFALAVVLTPPVIARGLLRLLHGAGHVAPAELIPLLLPGLVGMVFSCISGLIALRFLSRALENGRWRYFGIYCLCASAVVGIAALRGF